MKTATLYLGGKAHPVKIIGGSRYLSAEKLGVEFDSIRPKPPPPTSSVTLNDSNTRSFESGDDGLIVSIISEPNMVMKLFNTSSENETMNVVRMDQAYREFKALKIISSTPPTPHPNFVSLYSRDGLENCQLEIHNSSMERCIGFRMSFIPNLKYIEDMLPHMGFSFNGDGLPVYRFDHRNELLKFIVVQMFRVLKHLQACQIRHRDLDTMNMKIKVPEFQLYVFDFARADLPDKLGFEKTANPDVIIEEAMTKRTQNDSLFETCNHVNYNEIQKITDLYKSVLEAYRNPLDSLMDSYGFYSTDDKKSDYSAFKTQYRHLYGTHKRRDFGWKANDVPARKLSNYFEIENALIGSFIERSWKQPVDEATLDLDQDSLREALHNVSTVYHHDKYDMRKYSPRIIYVSKQYNAMHGGTNPFS